MQRVAIIGDTGAGKTCFLAVLRWLGELGADSCFVNVAVDGETKKYFDGLYETLSMCRVPDGSAAAHSLVFSQKYKRRDDGSCTQFDFEVIDYRGADTGKVEKGDALLESWLDSDVILALVPVDAIQDSFKGRDNLRCLSNILSRLEGRAHEKRLAVVLTQSDKIGFTSEEHGQEAAREFLQEKFPQFDRDMAAFGFKTCQYFALASLGVEPTKDENGFACLARDEVGGPVIKCFGYEELFDWLSVVKSEQMVHAVVRRIVGSLAFKITASLALCAAIVLIVRAGVLHQLEQRANGIFLSESASLELKANALARVSPKVRISGLETLCERFEKEAERSAPAELGGVLDKWDVFIRKAQLTADERFPLNEIKRRVQDRIDDDYLDRIKGLREAERYGDARDMIAAYHRDRLHTSGRHWKEIEGINHEVATTTEIGRRRTIADIRVGNPDDSVGMQEKVQKIREYARVTASLSEMERRDMTNAVEVMERLLTQKRFKIRGVHVGQLGKSDTCYFRMAADVGAGCSLAKDRDAGHAGIITSEKESGKEPQWDEGEFDCAEIEWQPGKTLRCEWYEKRWVRKDALIADFECAKDDWLALLRMLQPRTPMGKRAGYKNAEGIPWMTISCEGFDDPKLELELVKQYVYPGTYWTKGGD